MVELGARDAINLDGGGSTSLISDARLVNRPREEHGLDLPVGRPICDRIAASSARPEKRPDGLDIFVAHRGRTRSTLGFVRRGERPPPGMEPITYAPSRVNRVKDEHPRALRALITVAAGLVFGLLAFAPPAPRSAAGAVQRLAGDKVDGPTALAFTPDGRMIVTSQYGTVHVHDGTALRTSRSTSADDVCTNAERGVLGVAVDPDFATNHYVYLYYTRKTGCGCPVNDANAAAGPAARSTASRASCSGTTTRSTLGQRDGADRQHPVAARQPQRRRPPVRQGRLPVRERRRRRLRLARQQRLPGANDAARDQHVLLGKVLRITRDGDIPADNPFQGADTARCNVTGRTTAGRKCQETFASGLRNPFRLAFDPNAAGTRFFINDVGQHTWEEIDEGQAGADYGWNVREGFCANSSTHRLRPAPGRDDRTRSTPTTTTPAAPRSRAAHSFPTGSGPPRTTAPTCTPTSSAARSSRSSRTARRLRQHDLRNRHRRDRRRCASVRTAPAQASTTHLDYGAGRGAPDHPHRRRRTTRRSPSRAPTPPSGDLPLHGGLRRQRSRATPTATTLTYDWDFGDGSAICARRDVPRTPTRPPVPTPSTVTVRDTSGASDTETIVIHAGNAAPAVTIVSPTEDKQFYVGEQIVLNASATDDEDGALSGQRAHLEGLPRARRPHAPVHGADQGQRHPGDHARPRERSPPPPAAGSRSSSRCATPTAARRR